MNVSRSRCTTEGTDRPSGRPLGLINNHYESSSARCSRRTVFHSLIFQFIGKGRQTEKKSQVEYAGYMSDTITDETERHSLLDSMETVARCAAGVS